MYSFWWCVGNRNWYPLITEPPADTASIKEVTRPPPVHYQSQKRRALYANPARPPSRHPSPASIHASSVPPPLFLCTISSSGNEAYYFQTRKPSFTVSTSVVKDFFGGGKKKRCKWDRRGQECQDIKLEISPTKGINMTFVLNVPRLDAIHKLCTFGEDVKIRCISSREKVCFDCICTSRPWIE